MSIPTENTLTLNVTHQLLKKIEKNFTNAVAFSPSRRMEKLRGYDVKLDFAKCIVFQFKRPKLINLKTKKNPIRFHLNNDQLLVLQSNFSSNEAFFGLPLILSSSELKYAYRHTFYIDVHNILTNTSFIDVINPNGFNFKGKIRNGSRYEINSIINNNKMICKIINCDYGLSLFEEDVLTKKFNKLIKRIDEFNRIIFDEKSIFKDKIENKISKRIEFQKNLIKKEKITCEDEIDFDDMGESLRNQFHDLKILANERKNFDPSTYKIKNSKINIFERNS